MKVEIRNAKKEDIEEIFKLGCKLEDALKASRIKKRHFHEKSEFVEFIKKPKDNIFLVAIISGNVAGFLYAKILSEDWCMLDNIAVDKKYQNHGIGSLLVNKLYEVLRKRKVDYIQILEEIHHKKTRKFWKDKGFREEKVFVWADKILK